MTTFSKSKLSSSRHGIQDFRVSCSLKIIFDISHGSHKVYGWIKDGLPWSLAAVLFELLVDKLVPPISCQIEVSEVIFNANRGWNNGRLPFTNSAIK